MDDRELFLKSINEARTQYEENARLEEQHKKNIAALAEAMKKYDPVPTEEELKEQEQRARDIAALESYMAKLEEKVEEVYEEPEPTEQLKEALVHYEEHVVVEPEPIIEAAAEPVAIPLGAQPLPQFPEKTLVTKSVEKLAKIPRDKYESETDALPKTLRNELDLMKKTLTDLHRFARNASGVSYGGGAGDVTELDHRAIVVYSDYTATRKDYYIGVNCPTTCTITLPSTGIKNGRLLVVKDESGNCATNHITVVAGDGGTIDNDTTAIMGINNMTLQFIYRDGWRII